MEGARWLALVVLCGCSADAVSDAGARDAGAGDARIDGGRDAQAAADGAIDGGGMDGGSPCGVPRADVSSPPEGASWRYGGGVGYPDLVAPEGPCTTLVRDRASLEDALASARPGHVVYVADDAAIDLGGATLCIGAGVTLASGRGRTPSRAGGLLHTSVSSSEPMLRACGDGVRITGLRIRGADPTRCPCPGLLDPACSGCGEPSTFGVRIEGFDRAEIDNCELSGWSFTAVHVKDAVGAHVHHDHIHHNQRAGVGYGVELSGARDTRVLVEHVRFDANRHAIAGNGDPTQSYEARENLVLASATGQSFDMHGIAERASGAGQPWAGDDIRVHHNHVLPQADYQVIIRGIPATGAWIYSNCFTTNRVARQRFFFDGGVDSGGAFIGLFEGVDPSGAVAENIRGARADECRAFRLCASAGGVGPPELLAEASETIGELRVADLDGDGRSDVFRADGTAWWWLASGLGAWERLIVSSYPLGALRFGDFDGDGSDDAFIATGTSWRISRGARTGWIDVNAMSERLDVLALADLDGDGATDVFRADGTGWYISRGARGAWELLSDRAEPLAELAFGDFDADGADDVLHANGTAWLYSPRGTGAWRRLAAFSEGLEGVLFADLDGDGRADALRAGGDRWQVSWAARSAWETLAHASEPTSELAMGDFDGDGRADLMRARCH